MLKVIWLVLCLVTVSKSYIVPKLLLPYYDQVQVNYTLSSEEGCYTWRSLNPAVASVVPIQTSHECSSTAVVYVESKSPSRKTTLVLAESEVSGTIMQCDIIIDRIHSIDIISRTRELYLEDPPERLKIRALDEEGNTFSSTAGMLFDWNLLQDVETMGDGDTAVLAHTILSIERFIDTMYSSDSYVEQLEKDGKQSDTILLSGLQTGTALVTAQLTSTLDVHSAKIRITVRDKVLLNPSGDVWLPRFGSIRYIVEKWRRGRPTEVQMPNPQYFLELAKQRQLNPVVSFNLNTSVVVGQEIGNSSIYLMDRNLKQQTLQASSDIFVTEPAYLKISIQPDNRWVLETGRFYIIRIDMYDHENHRLWPTYNVRIVANISRVHFKVLDSSPNGTWHSVRTIVKGKTEIFAKLDSIITEDGKEHDYNPEINAKQMAEIFDPIEVHPPTVVFPWQPKPTLYKRQLTATGGSGNYTWSIEKSQLALVTGAGVVMTKIEQTYRQPEVGSATVQATDVRNPAHWGTSKVIVAPIVEVLFASSPREAEIGAFLDVYLVMKAKVNEDHLPVGDCRESGTMWSVEDPSIFEDYPNFQVQIHDGKAPNMSCDGRRLKALREGYTTITVSYVQTYPDGTSVQLEATIMIAAFPALQAVDPTNLAVVSLDSTKTLRFTGGPIRWPLWHAGYQRNVENSDKEIIQISQVTSSKREHQVVARCLHLGAANVRLFVYNKPCVTNPFPVQASVVVRVSCAIPSRVEVNVPALLPSCPLHSIHSIQTVALLARELPINVTAFDNLSNMFDNYSSIHREWLSNFQGTVFTLSANLFVATPPSKQQKHFVNQVAVMSSAPGEQLITVTLPRYVSGTSADVCNVYDCTRLEPEVSGSVTVLVVKEPYVSPSQLVIYNHVNSSNDIAIKGGSGHFYHTLKQGSNAAIVSDTKSNRLKVKAVEVGKTQITITDYCLDSTISAVADVSVVEIGNIHLKAASRMEVGSWAEATMKVFDNSGRELPARFLEFVNIQLSTTPPGIVVADKVHSSPSANMVVMSDVNAINVGSTSLVAVASTRSGRTISSNVVHVLVFPVVELLPPVVTLIRHASYQLMIKGGPHSDYTVKYSVQDSSSKDPVIRISPSGIVHALDVGDVKVTAQIVMHDGSTFTCKAPSHVRVVRLTGVRISCPLTRFHVGRVVPLYVEGVNGETPLSFGSATPGLIFRWRAANPGVIRLRTAHEHAGITSPPSMQFSILAEGIGSGYSSVSVRVTAEDPAKKQLTATEFNAEITLSVFEPLVLWNTNNKHWNSANSLLITPSTSHTIQSNRDGVAQEMLYEVLRSGDCKVNVKQVLDDCVAVTAKGVLSTGPNPCEATVRVTSVERFTVNQTLDLHVTVRHVSYVVARSQTIFQLKESTTSTAFPLSSSIRFVVDQFEDTGEVFDETSHSVVLAQNRHDLVEVEPDSGNRSFLVHALMEGTTIMSVASFLDQTTSYTYYFPVNVAQAITPGNAVLTVGLRFCFTSDFTNAAGAPGDWSTSNQKHVHIDVHSGAAIALASTTTDVTYTTSSFTGRTQVTTKPFTASFARNKLPSLISDTRNEFIVPIDLTPSHQDTDAECKGLEDQMNTIARSLLLCTVHFEHTESHSFSSTAKFIPDLGRYACVIENKAADRKELISDERIKIALVSKSRDAGSVLGGDVTVPFATRFTIDLSAKKLVAGSNVTVCVNANGLVLRTLQISSDKPPVLTIKDIDEQTRYMTRCYLLSADEKAHRQTIVVKIFTEITSQAETFELSIEGDSELGIFNPDCPAQQRPWLGFYEDTYRMMIYTIITVVITTLIIMAVCGAFRWMTQDVAYQPSTSFLARTPPRGVYSPARSPRSPRNASMSPSPKVRLWSRYYEPQ